MPFDNWPEQERATGRAGTGAFGGLSGTVPGTMDTIFTISGIFFLYNFLVRLSGIIGNGVHSVQKPDRFPGTPGTLRVFSGIFFLYDFLVRLSRNKGSSARSARKNIIVIPDRAPPVPAETRGLAGSRIMAQP